MKFKIFINLSSAFLGILFYLSQSGVYGIEPNDTNWNVQAVMFDQIHAPDAWSFKTDCEAIKIAVIDTGVDYTHPDLETNIAKDKEGRSYGWDFVHNRAGAMDDAGHGTFVAGLIGAEGNNGVGVTGVCWQAQILPIKALDQHGSGFSSDLIAAMRYADEQGAKVINASYGMVGGQLIFSSLEAKVLSELAVDGKFMVKASGNDGLDLDKTLKQSRNSLPTNFFLVGAVDSNDKLTSFSNYGATNVDLVAPGSIINSTTLHSGYGYGSGTSFSTPLVTGAMALVWAQNPAAPYAKVKDRVLALAARKSALEDRIENGGARLDLKDFGNP